MLSTVLDRIRQRTGTQDLFTRAGLSSFQSAIRTDLGNVASQWNSALYPLLASIAEPSGIDALVKGLAGNTLWSDVDASSGSNSIFYSSALGRRLTIKESLEVIALQLASLATSGGGAAALDELNYTADQAGGFSDVTNAQVLTNILLSGSGAFEPKTLPVGGGIFYLDPADSDWHLAQADAAANGPAKFKALYVPALYGGSDYPVIRQGFARVASPAMVWSDTPPTQAGVPIYLSTSVGGQFQNTIPSTSTEVINIIGYVVAINDTTIDVYLELNENYTVVP